VAGGVAAAAGGVGMMAAPDTAPGASAKGPSKPAPKEDDLLTSGNPADLVEETRPAPKVPAQDDVQPQVAKAPTDYSAKARELINRLNDMRRQAGGEVPQAKEMMAEIDRLLALGNEQRREPDFQPGDDASAKFKQAQAILDQLNAMYREGLSPQSQQAQQMMAEVRKLQAEQPASRQPVAATPQFTKRYLKQETTVAGFDFSQISDEQLKAAVDDLMHNPFALRTTPVAQRQATIDEYNRREAARGAKPAPAPAAPVAAAPVAPNVEANLEASASPIVADPEPDVGTPRYSRATPGDHVARAREIMAENPGMSAKEAAALAAREQIRSQYKEMEENRPEGGYPMGRWGDEYYAATGAPEKPAAEEPDYYDGLVVTAEDVDRMSDKQIVHNMRHTGAGAGYNDYRATQPHGRSTSRASATAPTSRWRTRVSDPTERPSSLRIDRLAWTPRPRWLGLIGGLMPCWPAWPSVPAFLQKRLGRRGTRRSLRLTARSKWMTD